jgi:hypothetical protein
MATGRIETMDDLRKERQEPQSPGIELHSHRASSSDADLSLLSPSFTQTSSSGYEPLIRRPVLPPRPSSTSFNKHPSETIELEQTASKDQDPLWDPLSSKGSGTPPPKAFKKTHQFLGLNLGYWRQPARHFSIFAILMVVTIIPLYFVSVGYEFQNNEPEPFGYDCYGSSDGWSFVGINLRFGAFNYGSAKALDLAWNWIVGRGLQALLTLLAYRVFHDALLRAAEMTPLSFELYAALSLYATRLDVIWQLMKAMARKGNWRTKAIFIWLFISTIYLLTFPRFVIFSLRKIWSNFF